MPTPRLLLSMMRPSKRAVAGRLRLPAIDCSSAPPNRKLNCVVLDFCTMHACTHGVPYRLNTFPTLHLKGTSQPMELTDGLALHVSDVGAASAGALLTAKEVKRTRGICLCLYPRRTGQS